MELKLWSSNENGSLYSLSGTLFPTCWNAISASVVRNELLDKVDSRDGCLSKLFLTELPTDLKGRKCEIGCVNRFVFSWIDECDRTPWLCCVPNIAFWDINLKYKFLFQWKRDLFKPMYICVSRNYINSYLGFLLGL